MLPWFILVYITVYIIVDLDVVAKIIDMVDIVFSDFLSVLN